MCCMWLERSPEQIRREEREFGAGTVRVYSSARGDYLESSQSLLVAHVDSAKKFLDVAFETRSILFEFHHCGLCLCVYLC